MNIKSKMYIDPSLQSVIGPHIATARATIGLSNDHEQQIIHTILYTLAGFGLARASRQHYGITWVPTKKPKRKKLVRGSPIEGGLALAIAEDGKHGTQSMARSLQLILKDMVEVEKDADPEWADCITVRNKLGHLANCGNALLGEGLANELIWVASPNLINRYTVGLPWGPYDPFPWLPFIVIDDVLESEIERLWNNSWVNFGAAEDRRLFTCSWLLRLERRGDAIAYWDKRLKWKASADFIKSIGNLV